MIKGIGKGIGGVIFKPPAGMLTLCITQRLFRRGNLILTQHSRSLGTLWISLGWNSQTTSKVARQERGAFYYGISDSARH